MTRRRLLFLSHNVRHPRCECLVHAISRDFDIVAPPYSVLHSSRLSLSSRSMANILSLGVSTLGNDMPIHLDGIDVFIHPFMRNANFVHDYHVPLVPELRWLGHITAALYARVMLPDSIRKAKAIIAPNHRMLAHAAEYAKLPESHVVPNYPPSNFFVDVSQEEARIRLGLPIDRQIALFVGGSRLREIYGIGLLLRSWMNVRKRTPQALLCVLGPTQQLGIDQDSIRKLEGKGMLFPGNVRHSAVPLWIAAADLCLSQRTPGFPVRFYNIHDSIKLSEYALFRKPIVAAGYLPGPDYIAADTTVESYSKAILSGLRGEAPRPTPHTWEENVPTIRKAYATLLG